MKIVIIHSPQSFPTLYEILSSVEHKIENVGNQTVDGSHWFPQGLSNLRVSKSWQNYIFGWTIPLSSIDSIIRAMMLITTKKQI